MAVALGRVFVSAGDLKDGGQRDAAALHVFDQALQGGPIVDGQAAFSFVGIGADDFYTSPVGVLLDLVRLAVRGVLLD